eukprot:159348_1
MSLKLIYFVATILFGSFVGSVRLLGCLGCCTRSSRVTPKTEPEDIITAFDNCVFSADALYSIMVNNSKTDGSGSGDAEYPLSPKSFMVSTMQSLQPQLDIKALEDTTEMLPKNVNWFEVDSHYITQQNNSFIQINMDNYLITLTAFDCTHMLYFLGHYLSFNQSAFAVEFQSIFEYFTQFRNGLYRVNVKTLIENYEPMRARLLGLLEYRSPSNEDIPSHIADDRQRIQPSPWSRHRMRMRQVEQTPTTSSEGKSRYTRRASVPTYFWGKDWRKWNKRPLSFIGLHPAETDTEIKALLWRIAMEMDKIKVFITGEDNKKCGVNSVRDVLKHRKATDVFHRNFFKEAIERTNSFFHQRNIMSKFMSVPDQDKKVYSGLGQMFMFDLLKFAGSICTERSEKGCYPKVRLTNLAKCLRKDDMFCLEIQFDPTLFGGYQGWKEKMVVRNEYLKHLLIYEQIPLKFIDIHKQGHVMYLMNVVLQFAMVSGRCGYGWNEKDEPFQASLVCEVSMSNIGPFKPKTGHFKIPTNLVEKGNRTNDTADGNWILMKDFTGLDFKDIEAAESMSPDPLNDGFGNTPNLEDGITERDLQKHEMRMKHVNMDIESIRQRIKSTLTSTKLTNQSSPGRRLGNKYAQ